MSQSRLSRWTAVAALLAASCVPLTAAPAHAVGTDAVCTGTQNITYTPGLTLVPTPTAVSVTTAYANCGLLSEPGLTSGSSSSTAEQTLSCLRPLTPGSGSLTIKWNTGETSTFSYTRTIARVAGQIVVTRTGKIDSGKFEGRSAKEVIAGPTLDAHKCAGKGITERLGAVTLTITSP
ncbi:hypothetical protein [Streptomyces purpurogeneiscleroticus]|uniref:hypothetical protein n=1 Tax=Streptomyces purpurogeneiscleroticus TaxID=68259 RepID=UPI001CBE023A|nr:hypothetical protein [Streptomyces purpurogeneiscleroticus]MBZ4015636.1 hypothetical protein [Streptomyces purpurogeneiscleroticus]